MFIQHFGSLCPSKQPKNSQNHMIVWFKIAKIHFSKLQFFQDDPTILSKFLKGFQTGNPVVPFLSDPLEFHIQQLIKMFL